MRLLNTTTKKLESFNDLNVPPYAILSHMWGKDEDEVSFSDIVGSDDARREAMKRKGYAKIEGACKQATEDEWDYIWIDTCCINKESSAELSEAINSMYQWYQKAEVCYVYLGDVYSGHNWNIYAGGHNQKATPKSTRKWMGVKRITLPKRMKVTKEDSTIEMDGNKKKDGSIDIEMVSFERSRWFSRGWTLQELIAPQFVVFYSADWIDIGTRASLQAVISARTRIRVEMLVAYDPKKASVAERMSWAASRETTRAEDMAYCLMGLFGVNMPLLYGEGNRAFRRLQEEIMKVSDDHSLFAWKSSFNDYTNLNDVYIATRGLLANSPREFRDGMDIASSNDGAFSPYSMTNQGLQIQLPLESINPKRGLIGIRDTNHTQDVFKATLKCTIRDKEPARWVVIYLKKIKDGHYERMFAHLLDETETNPKNVELTSLLVPQIDTSTTNGLPKLTTIRVKILPTESGFTSYGFNLVNGYEHPGKYGGGNHYSTTFFDSPEGNHFAVVAGSEDGIVWLDVVDVTEDWDSENAYKEGGDQYNQVLKHLDRLSVRISNLSVVVSAKKFNNHPSEPYIQVTVDIQRESILARAPSPTSISNCFVPCGIRNTVNIQREPILAKGWYAPSPTSISNRFDNSFVFYHGNHAVYRDFKKEYCDWIAVFNPKVKRILNVSPVHSTLCLPDSGNSFSVQFSPDGKYLAIVQMFGRVKIYYTNTGELCNEQEEIDQFPRCVCFSPDGKSLATGYNDGRIKVWDVEKGYESYDHKLIFSDHQDDTHDCHSLCFSPDCHLIISGSFYGTIKIWDIANKTSHLFVMDNPKSFMRPVEVSCNDRLVAASSTWSSTVWIWDIATKQLVKKLGGYNIAVFTPDGEGLVVGGGDRLGYLNVGELVPAQAVERIEDFNDTEPIDSPMVVQGEASQWEISELPVTSIAVSHDGHWVIFGSYGGRMEFWDLKNVTPRFMLQGHVVPVDSVAISSVGNIFATNSHEEGVRIWRYDYI